MTATGAPPMPPVVTLCGSTKFRDDFLAEAKRLTLEGAIVISVGVFAHHEPGFDPDGPTKAMLDELHLRKIDLAGRVHVVNPGGYVGTSTRREIAYAADRGKAVTYMVDVPAQPVAGPSGCGDPECPTCHPEYYGDDAAPETGANEETDYRPGVVL